MGRTAHLDCIEHICLEMLMAQCKECPLGALWILVSRWVGPEARGQDFLVEHCMVLYSIAL